MVPVLLIVVPLLAGLAAFFIRNERSVRAWSLLTSLATLVIAIAGSCNSFGESALSFSGEWMSMMGSSFTVGFDGTASILCLLNAVAYPLVILGTWNTSHRNAHNFFGLMLLAQAGMMGVFVAMDALLFYFFWELALIPMYFLCSLWGGEKRIKVTFKFFIYTFLGSILMLIGILWVQSQTPGKSFSIQAFYNNGIAGPKQQWMFWLFFLAFAIKMPVFPLHTWQPDTYEQAPTATTMILSGVMVKMGLLGVLRWLIPVLPAASDVWSIFIPPLALVGLIYASLIAIRQDDLKRLVAYSSIAHIGFICAAAFSENIYGIQGVMIQMFSHGINIIGLWIVIDIIERRYGTRKMSELGGLAAKAPAMAILFVTICLANIALPLTNAFVGEFLMFNGLFNAPTSWNIWFTVMAGIGIILSAVYTLNMIRKVFYGEEGAAVVNATDISITEKIALGVIVILIFWFGVYPQPLLDMTQESSEAIISKVNAIISRK